MSVIARIRARRLANAGELAVEVGRWKRAQGGWSLQDELDLLATLRRTDLLAEFAPGA